MSLLELLRRALRPRIYGYGTYNIQIGRCIERNFSRQTYKFPSCR